MKVSRDSGVEVRKDWTGKMMELSCYDENDNPIYGYDGERNSSGLDADRADSIPASVCSENCKPCLAHYHSLSPPLGALQCFVTTPARGMDQRFQ